MTVFTFRTNKKILRRNMFIYLGVSLFVMLFGFIYEQFSHSVLSWFMVYAFLVPLILGFIPYLLLYVFNDETHPSEMTSNLYNAGVATLTICSIYIGVLEIYGTTRELHVNILLFSGLILLVSGIVTYIIALMKKMK